MKPDRILFIAPTRIGDAVLATPVLRYIAEHYPKARVTIATSPLSAPLFEGYPLLERIFRMQKKKHNRHWIDLLCATIGTRWHSVWDMRGSATGYLLRAGERRRFRGSREPIAKRDQLAKQLNTGPLQWPTLWPLPEHVAQAAALLPEGGRYLIFAPTANWPPKQWPMEYFIALGHMLLGAGGIADGWRPVVISAGAESAEAMQLVDALSPYRPINLTQGDIPLLSVYACMQRAHGFIGNDSGLMHMAAASGVPTLALYGETAHAVATFFPHGPRGRAVVDPQSKMVNLLPEHVASEFAALLASN